jgi:hypothetical protein
LIIFPTTKAFYRQEYERLLQLLIEAAREREVKIRLLVGADNSIKREIIKLRRNQELIDIQPLQMSLQTNLLVIMVDKALSIAIELKDDVEDASDTIGLTTYSNSESTVMSYVSIFDNLWIKKELSKEKRRGMASQT